MKFANQDIVVARWLRRQIHEVKFDDEAIDMLLAGALSGARERHAQVADRHQHTAGCDGAGCKAVIAKSIRADTVFDGEITDS